MYVIQDARTGMYLCKFLGYWTWTTKALKAHRYGGTKAPNRVARLRPGCVVVELQP